MEELDSEPMMVVPSPGAFSLSPKSQTESTASLSADHFSLEECPNFTACGLGCAMKVAEECVMDMPSNDHCAAMALRMLAMYTGTLRHAGIGCAVMPLVESFGFISEFEGHCFAGPETLKPCGLFPPILSSLWCWLHVEERLMLAVISHPANLFAEQGTENMSEIYRFMLHCSNH